MPNWFLKALHWLDKYLHCKLLFGAVDFAGDADYVNIGDITSLDNTEFSFSCWIKSDQTTADGMILVKGPQATSTPIFIWRDESVGGGSQVGNSKAISFLINTMFAQKQKIK